MSLRAHLSYANVVSTLCLFILLGGVAFAATQLPKNSVGTKQLKKNAVNGAKVADGSLSAADISGSVNSAVNATEAAHAARATVADRASSADQAGNATLLGGAPASSFYPSSGVERFDLEVEETVEGSHDHPLGTIGPLSLDLACNKAASSMTIGLTASSSAPGATIYAGFTTNDPLTGAEIYPLSGGKTDFFTRLDNGLGESGTGEMIYRDATTTITMTYGYFVSDLLDECRLSGAALQS